MIKLRNTKRKRERYARGIATRKARATERLEAQLSVARAEGYNRAHDEFSANARERIPPPAILTPGLIEHFGLMLTANAHLTEAIARLLGGKRE